MPNSRSVVLRQLAAGSLSLSEAAQALGTTEARAKELLEVFELTRELMPAPSALGGSRRGLALLVAASAMLGALGATAASSACPNGYQYCFASGQPARAVEVNYNFSQIKEWVEAKTGGVASGAASSASITTAGLAVNTPGAASFGSTTRQMINLFQTGYGIGVQNSTQYFRTGGGFAWYLNGSHNDTQWNSGGGSTLMTLTSGGDLGLAGNAWGSGPTTQHSAPSTAPNFGNANAWTSFDCPGGQFVCGLVMGHIGGDSQYWTGARLSLRCCAL